MAKDPPFVQETTLGLLIFLRRRKLGLTQAEYAAKIDVSRAQLAQWETGRGLGALAKQSRAVGFETTSSVATYSVASLWEDTDKYGWQRDYMRKLAREYPNLRWEPLPETTIPDEVARLDWEKIRRDVLAFLGSQFKRLSEADREDVAEDAIVRALKHPKTCDATQPEAWVCSIAKNVAMERLRQPRSLGDAPPVEGAPLEAKGGVSALDQAKHDDRARRLAAFAKQHGLDKSDLHRVKVVHDEQCGISNGGNECTCPKPVFRVVPADAP